MKKLACLVAALVLCVALIGRAADKTPSAQPAVTLVKSGDWGADGDFCVGYKFEVLTPITVTELGVFDREGSGKLKGTEPVKIGLWDADGKMLVSTAIPLKTQAEAGVFYVPIKPAHLAPGYYVIACVSPSIGERYWFNAEMTTASQIKWEQALYNPGTELNCPTTPAPGGGYFGPNFKIVAGDVNVVDTTAQTKISVDQPDDREVFQRDDRNQGGIPIACTAPVEAKVQARAMESGKPIGDWIELKSGSSPGSFAGKLQVPGGWYRLELRASEGGKIIAMAVVDHVGVGEVFLTCGQSNSCNHGRPRQSAKSDEVSACDWQSGQWSHAEDPEPGAEGDGGSPWPLLGDLLVAKYHVPVGFISVGVGNTTVGQWLPNGDLYKRIKTGLGRAGLHGLRAILWHQGESDSVEGTSTDEYYHALSLIIARSRRDAGYDVPWGVALVSYHPSASADKQKPIIAGQKLVIEKEPKVFQGASTDDFHLHDYMADGVHFNAAGLAAHARGWEQALAPVIP
jgi:hypothetical protein